MKTRAMDLKLTEILSKQPVDWDYILNENLDHLDYIAFCIHGISRSVNFARYATAQGLAITAVAGGLKELLYFTNDKRDEIFEKLKGKEIIICVEEEDRDMIEFDIMIEILQINGFTVRRAQSTIPEMQFKEVFPEALV